MGVRHHVCFSSENKEKPREFSTLFQSAHFLLMTLYATASPLGDIMIINTSFCFGHLILYILYLVGYPDETKAYGSGIKYVYNKPAAD